VLYARVGSTLTRKYLTSLERLARHKHSSLPQTLVNYVRKKVLQHRAQSYNFIETIPSNALPGLATLTIFNASHSPNLIRIGSNAFQDNRALTTIVLTASKRLKDFDPDALTVAPFDEEIKLRLVLQDMDMTVVDKNMADWCRCYKTSPEAIIIKLFCP
jgi:hypothetical protein